MIERLICTGLINSTEYLQQIRPAWETRYIASRSAAMIADWCIEFFDEFQQAPVRNIDDIYWDKRNSGQIPQDMIEEIDEDLEDLWHEFDEEFNAGYALKQTGKYFTQRAIEIHQHEVETLMEEGDLEGAQALAANFRGPTFAVADDLDLGDESALERIDHVFSTTYDPLIRYPGALGDMLNNHLIRGGFVSLLSTEKRGKSFWLMDMALRAARQYKVAFFQAGDMTEGQQIKRIASYLTKLPILDKYTGEVFNPCPDCVRNQLDTCDKKERKGTFGLFTAGEYEEESFRMNITREHLIECWEDYENDYISCTNCDEWHERPLGTPWLVPEHISHVVTVEEAKRETERFFQQKKRRFKISTHINDSLTVTNIRNIVNRWEREDKFVPDVIVIDYADLLVYEKAKDHRHGQNEIWKNLRALSQERNVLVLTATQAGAKAYEHNILRMSDFSEDKRKYAHVTAMFGLNQDKHGREKKLGIMRLNEMVVREGEFYSTRSVSVLQNLNLGRPFLDSYI